MEAVTEGISGLSLSTMQLLVVGVATVLLLAVGAWIATRLLARTPGERLAGELAEYDACSVLMHPNPDPDAMAAAMGVATLAGERECTPTLHYPGQIRHHENRAFRTLLDADMASIDAADELEAPVVLVDHSEPRGFSDCDTIEPLAVVDHHPGDGTGSAFTDSRPDHGACATIVAEYLEDVVGVPNDPDAENGDGVPWEVATGLMYGIQTDTNHLTSGCHPADFAASSYLYPGIDPDVLERIANPPVDGEVLDVKATAIRNRDIDGSFAIADVGSVSNVDAIPQAADELIRLEGITAVVVFGDRDGTIHCSGRSRDDRVHMGDALAAVADDTPSADAGGHARMGGGQFPIEALERTGPAAGVDRSALRERLFDALAGDV
jgi:nanoRNase/pAp phosphatase (c-di-AMP/oligoRNAs hydrolase)